METHIFSETVTTLHIRHVCPGAVTRSVSRGLGSASSVSGGPYSPSYPGMTPWPSIPPFLPRHRRLCTAPCTAPLVPLASLSSLQSKDSLLCSPPTRRACTPHFQNQAGSVGGSPSLQHCVLLPTGKGLGCPSELT